MKNADAIREFADTASVRRYFARIGRLMEILKGLSERETTQALHRWEHQVLLDEIDRLAASFRALALKYAMIGQPGCRLGGPLLVDVRDSGFVSFKEFMHLESDRAAAPERLRDLPDGATLKDRMVDHVLRERTMPRDLQYALSQRLYLDAILARPLFGHRNPPRIAAVAPKDGQPRAVLISWAVFDSTRNVPTLYLMVAEDTGEVPLDRSEERLQAVSTVLLNQAISTLKMVTIASAIDKDFEDLHPKSLKRVSIGPLYSGFTEHNDAIQRIIEHIPDAEADWVLGWTVESIVSKESRRVRRGMFSSDTQQQIWHLDPYVAEALEGGASDVRRNMVLPYEAYQALTDDPANPLNGVTKWVVATDGRIIPNL